MKRLKNFVPVVLAMLGLTEFKKKEDGKLYLSDEEKETLVSAGLNETFIATFEAELNQPETPGAPGDQAKQNAAYVALVQQATAQVMAKEEELASLKAEAAKQKADYTKEIEAKEAQISNLNKQIATLADLPDAEGNVKPAPAAAGKFDLQDTRQLGGFQGEFFALDRPYNQRARAALLRAQGIDAQATLAVPADFSRLKEDLGAFYRTPWRDRIQSFIVLLPSIQDIFPMESGHQDLDTLVNVWFQELSQADNTIGSKFENVTKGSYEFGTETLRMYGVMFAHTFRDLKQLEKSWIGYLNREGSNPVKLSFIEYLLVEMAKLLHNEQQLRFINGVRVEPDPNKPGRAMEAADGIYEYLRKRIDGHIDFTPNGGLTGRTVYQIKPFELPSITEGNIGEVFYKGTSMVPAKFRDTGKLVLFIPSWMVPLYNKYNEVHYGQNRDYEKNINYVKEFPSVKIVPLANADNHRRIFWTIEGNIKTYCQIEGEMNMFSMEQHNWALDVWSNWKESIQAEAVGYKYTDPAEMDGSRQLIWANGEDLPETYFVEGKADTNPSALRHSSIQTVANTGVFAITDITDAPVGKVITIKCGEGGENGVTIKKEGNFSLISGAWTPAKGEVIKLMKNADGKFIEISRGVDDSKEETYQFEPNATTPSVEGGTAFVTDPNTEATEITDLLGATEGVIYTLYGAGSTNASTISKAGKFEINSKMTLKDGSFIRLVKGAGGKFYEVSRG